ncbi:TraB/GumN family protein [Sphingomonas populi]|uniref:TraB/GumN family protein n=1 Tax=Sphingomonas populi TaxID=2484750 RepID=A0A4V2DDV8_9SPHN|nr:TraB/GumN family protein [Sphingomonas populi]RZF66338.1 TraB/GumN family protein [Sphingomonas populi]
MRFIGGIMARNGLALPRAGGSGAMCALTAALSLCWAAAPAAAQRIAYASFPASQTVTLRGQPVAAGPTIVYAALPLDDQTAPPGAALDDDAVSPEEAARGADALLLSQLSQNYRPHPAIWRIGDRDTTIYLFGTVHVLPPGFAWRDAAIDAIVARAGTLIVEAIDADAVPDFAAAHAGGTPLPPIAARVSPDHSAALRRFTDTLPPEAVGIMDEMPTWIAAIAVGFVRDTQAGELPGPGADDWIEAQFRSRHKPVIAIEDAAKVMRQVSAVPEAEQRRSLDKALDTPTPTRAERRAPTHAWAQGDLGAGSALTRDLATTGGGDALGGALLTQRNRAWVDALVRRLKVPGTALFAAGAGHFIGPDSVLALLRKRGVRVTRVQ